MPRADRPTLVFDLDGTLVDSAPDLVASMNAVLVRDGIPAFPLETARPFVGGGGRVLIRRGLAASGRETSDARLEEMFAAFIAHYQDHIADASHFYPGVEAALDRFAADGHRLAILTNKYERLAMKLLRALGGAARFAAIAGQDTFAIAKPNGAALRLTIEKAGGDPARAIMIGDTATDIETARDAGLPVIAVDFGYAQEPVTTLGPNLVISGFDALPAAVAALSEGLTSRPRATHVDTPARSGA